ncbi:MAG: hypothetical protein ABRQ38_15535 [Candidatus Eremiobacterota bacterium]
MLKDMQVEAAFDFTASRVSMYAISVRAYLSMIIISDVSMNSNWQ